MKQQKKKQEEDQFIVDNVSNAFKFLNVNDVKNIPGTALNKFFKLVDAGVRDIDLVSILKAEKYDSDLPNAKKEGAAKAASKQAGTSHLSQVQGTGQQSELDSIVVPDALAKMYTTLGIPKEKHKQHYMKALKSGG